jgi:hypothetical protein
MSRDARTSTPRGRWIALSFGTTVGAAVIAASISMGTAPVAGAVVDADPVSDLVGAFDPNAFNSSGAPTDSLGLLAYGLDTYLLGPSGLGDALDPGVDNLVGSGTVGSGPPTDADPVSDLVGAFDPNAFSSSGAPTDSFGLLAYGLDTYLLGPSGLGDALDPGVDNLLSSLPSGAASVLDADPVSDLVGALDPSAFNALGLPDGVLGDLAAGLDADLLAPLGLGALLDPVIDDLVGSGFTLF